MHVLTWFRFDKKLNMYGGHNMCLVGILLLSITKTEQASYDENYFQLKMRNVKTVSPFSGQFPGSTPLSCGACCRNSPDCQSFFFSQKKGTCELHDNIYDESKLTVHQAGETYFVREIGHFMPSKLLLFPYNEKAPKATYMTKNNTLIQSPYPKLKNVIALAYYPKMKLVYISSIRPNRITSYRPNGAYGNSCKGAFIAAAIDENRNYIHYSPFTKTRYLGKVDKGPVENKLKRVFSGTYVCPKGITLDSSKRTIYVTVYPANNKGTGQIMSMSYRYKNLKKINDVGAMSFFLIFNPIDKDVIYNEGNTLSKLNLKTSKTGTLMKIIGMEKGGSVSLVPNSDILLMNTHAKNKVFEINLNQKTLKKWSLKFLDNSKALIVRM